MMEQATRCNSTLGRSVGHNECDRNAARRAVGSTAQQNRCFCVLEKDP